MLLEILHVLRRYFAFVVLSHLPLSFRILVTTIFEINGLHAINTFSDSSQLQGITS
jgi:hypothetical protein